MSDTGTDPLAPPGETHGRASERFATLGADFAASISDGRELGASLCVIIDDEVEVDLWGGWADAGATAATATATATGEAARTPTPWTADTVTNVWSISKTAAALAALTLADRGALDLGSPVARYWPEFGAAGKAEITVRELLTHTAGVVAWDQPIRADEILDVEASSARLAAQEPWFAPGGEPGYAVTCYGHLIDAIVRRVDGRPLGAFVQDELADPLGADFWLGLPESEDERVSLVVPPPKVPLDPERRAPAGSISARAFTSPNVDARKSWSREWRAAGIGGAGGQANARSVARLVQAVAQDGVVDGTRMLRPETLDEVFTTRAEGHDQVLRLPIRWGAGFAHPAPGSAPWLPQDGRIAYWGGWGGALVICDADRRMTFAYVMNRMAASVIGSERSIALVRRAYETLGG